MLQQIERLRDYIGCAQALGSTPKEVYSIFWKETKNLRVRLKLDSYNPGRVYSIRTVYGPLHFRDNFGDITNLVGLFHHNVYRVGRLQEKGVILDVGANIGLAAAWFAHHNPGRAIYCFEPLAANAALIKLNCPAAQVEQVAVGERPGRVALNVDKDDVMASSIPCRWETQTVEFDVIALDEFASQQAIERVALMKVDVEGMELEILRGARQTLSRTHQVAMETHGLSRHEEAMGLLEQAGLSVRSEEFDGKTGLVFASR